MNQVVRPLAASGLFFSLAACSVLRPPAPNAPLAELPNQMQETIARVCQQRTVRRQGTAGFEMIADGKESYLARLAAVEAAQKTLEVQYYIWSDDVVGTAFADRLLAAADRGVKVRMLLDMTLGAQQEVRTAALAAHPNIQIAFFNPMTDMKGIFAGNPIPVIGDIDRMQNRMHNKMLIADAALIIGGGRNLGDTYFGVDRRHNMRDLDFIAIGPVVTAALNSFDLFWKSPLTRRGDPAKLTAVEREDLETMRRKIARKKRHLARRHDCPFPLSLSVDESIQTLHRLVDRMIWAEYEFVADPPERMLRQGKVASPVSHSLETAIRQSRHEVIMHAAYLIPQEGTLDLFKQVTRRGATVRLLTNSLASIDGMAAMAGIANRRRDVLQTGAELAELDARAPVRRDYIQTPRLTPLGMHTKGIVVDDRVSFIGSYNMDPRSKYINTETGVIIRSPAFAARLKSYLEEDLKPENCWQVTVNEQGRIRWLRHIPGRATIVHRFDPEAPLSRRIGYWLLTHLPWEDLL